MSLQEKTASLHTRGRKAHRFYEHLHYNHKRLENGRIGAQCVICNAILKNTAVARLRTHRKGCHLASSNNTLSGMYSDNGTQDFKHIKEEMPIEFETLSPPEDCQDEIQREQSFLDSRYDTETDCKVPIEERDDDATPHDPLAQAKNTSICTAGNDASQKMFSHDEEERDQPQQIPEITSYTAPIHEITNKKLKNTGPNNSYMNTMTPKLKEEIDISLAKFFFGCNIPFSVIGNVHFKRFIKALQPAYSLPSKETLSTTLLNKVCEDNLAANKKKFMKRSDLLKEK